MNQDLVSLENGIPSTTSLKVAEVFHKRHTEVLRGIRTLCANTPESFHGRNFASAFQDIPGPNGAVRKSPIFTMTRDGFTLLVMGYTGKEAMRFKLEYIEAFNAMEKEFMRRQSSVLPPADRSDLKALVDAKLSTCPAHLQGKARSELWARFNRHFRIAAYAQLPPEKMAEARDYIVELELRALRPVETRKTRAWRTPEHGAGLCPRILRAAWGAACQCRLGRKSCLALEPGGRYPDGKHIASHRPREEGCAQEEPPMLSHREVVAHPFS